MRIKRKSSGSAVSFLRGGVGLGEGVGLGGISSEIHPLIEQFRPDKINHYPNGDLLDDHDDHQNCDHQYYDDHGEDHHHVNGDNFHRHDHDHHGDQRQSHLDPVDSSKEGMVLQLLGASAYTA